ncbi:hypothetical protein KKC94_04880 [Patescibacteria group bacterium]|nr:hypothetical protein [Patescibacteria group bacterium]
MLSIDSLNRPLEDAPNFPNKDDLSGVLDDFSTPETPPEIECEEDPFEDGPSGLMTLEDYTEEVEAEKAQKEAGMRLHVIPPEEIDTEKVLAPPRIEMPNPNSRPRLVPPKPVAETRSNLSRALLPLLVLAGSCTAASAACLSSVTIEIDEQKHTFTPFSQKKEDPIPEIRVPSTPNALAIEPTIEKSSSPSTFHYKCDRQGRLVSAIIVCPDGCNDQNFVWNNELTGIEGYKPFEPTPFTVCREAKLPKYFSVNLNAL